MGDQSAEILDPDQPLKLSTGAEITVREMSWKEAKRFLGSLAGRASEFITTGPNGKNDVNINKLMSIIATDLGESLIVATTGMEPAAVGDLRLSDMLLCLDRALALNIRPEMIEAGKAVAGRFKNLVSKQ